jgi:ribosomal RNA-processing protein 9
MGYVETLFGHQDCIGDLDALKRESAVSCGGRDKTVRFWKIPDETQLVFRGGTKSKLREVLEGGMEEADADDDNEDGKEGKTLERRFVEGSIDCVAMIDESTFVSGGDSGFVLLYDGRELDF